MKILGSRLYFSGYPVASYGKITRHAGNISLRVLGVGGRASLFILPWTYMVMHIAMHISMCARNLLSRNLLNKLMKNPMKNLIYKLMIAALFATLLSGCALFGKDEEEDATAEEMYAIAKENLDKKNWLTAVDELRELEAKYPYGTHAEQAQLDTIYAHYRADAAGLAIAAADRFIKLHPTHQAVDYAYYLKGLANYRENNSLFGRIIGRDDLSDRDTSITRDAMNAFNDVHTLFPTSRYAADARVRAHYLHDSLARHELAVAAYYFSRNAHVAVVNRAKGVIEEYATTPSVEEALALLVFCYRQMELDDLSNDAHRVLMLSFPKSVYLRDDGKEVLVQNLRTPGSSEQVGEDRGFLAPILNIFNKEPAE